MRAAIMTTGLVTRPVLEGYLHCKYLAHLRLGGREGVRSDYENAVHEVRRERCLTITESLRARYAKQGMALRVSITRAELRKGANLILDAEGRVTLIDLGLARPEEPGGGATRCGTLRFAAPEQFGNGVEPLTPLLNHANNLKWSAVDEKSPSYR